MLLARKILLISVNQCSMPYPVFPLGIVYIASILKDAGYEIKVFDMLVESTDLFVIIDTYKPDYIGLSLRNIDNITIDQTHFYASSFSETVKKIRKKSNIPIILGGSGFSIFPDRLLKLTGADFGVRGEGEISFLSLLNCLKSNLSYTTIPGLVYRKNGNIIINPLQKCEINKIAQTHRPEYLSDYYLKNSSMLNIQTQRGCAFKCCYCTYPLIEGSNPRYRNSEDVCDEIAEIKKAGASYFFFVDSVFNNSAEHVSNICEEIIRRDFNMKWGCFLRPKSISQSLMDLMAKAGCAHIEFGTDSLCDSVLDAYGKHFTFDDVLHSSECARKANVHYAHFLIIGGPSETETTIKESFSNSRFIKKTVFFSFYGMRIYPNTPLYKLALKEGVIENGQNLLPPCFYITPHIPKNRIAEILTEFSRERRNWIVGEISSELYRIMGNLRKIGILGPLWEFLVK